MRSSINSLLIFYPLLLAIAVVTSGCVSSYTLNALGLALAQSTARATAVPTPYKPNTGNGGYSELRLGTSMYRVRFNGNKHTSESRSIDFALLRSADITLESGHTHFVIISEKSGSKTYTTTYPTTQSTSGTGYVDGNTVWLNTETVTHGGQTFSVSYPRAENVILCLSEADNQVALYDAVIISSELRAKYEIRNRSTYDRKRNSRQLTNHVDLGNRNPPINQIRGKRQPTIIDVRDSTFIALPSTNNIPTFTNVTVEELSTTDLQQIANAFELSTGTITAFRWGQLMGAKKGGTFYTIFVTAPSGSYQETLKLDRNGLVISRSRK